MKKRINSLLASTLVLSLATSSFAQENQENIAPQEEILQEITQETLSTSTNNSIYTLFSKKLDEYVNPFSAYLSDFTGDGQEEMLVFYFDGSGNGNTLDIWSHSNSAISLYQSIELPTFMVGDEDFYLGKTAWNTALVCGFGESSYNESNETFYSFYYCDQQGQLQNEVYKCLIFNGSTTYTLNWEASNKETFLERANWFHENALGGHHWMFGENNLLKTGFPKEENPTTNTILGFSDVASNAWYADFAQFAVENGFMTKGYTPTNFNPDDVATRGMVAEVLYTLSCFYGADNGYTGTSTANNFSDAVGHLFQDEVGFCKVHLDFKGIGDNRFGVNDSITREDCVLMLYTLFDDDYSNVKSANISNLNQFSDKEQISMYAQEGISWAIANGLMSGSDGKINPKGSLSRAELAVMLKKCAETFQLK